MKKILFTITCAIASLVVFAQQSKYETAMQTNLSSLDTSYRNAQNLANLSSAFERIANAEKTKWQPYYFAAYTTIMNGFMQKDPSNNDALAARASLFIDKADSLSPKNANVTLLKAMNSIVQMLVNPMARYAQYGSQSEKLLQLAMSQDPKNPMPYAFKASYVRNTPENFGGGCDNAMPYVEKAEALQTTFSTETPFDPNWAAGSIANLKKTCN